MVEHPLFARLYDPLTGPAEALFARHRQYLGSGLSGRVLDVGTGTGATLPYLAGAETTVLGLEPDPHMRRRAAAVARATTGEVALVAGDAERLPVGDDALDAAVAALVFCTIPNPEAALDELARVLRPGAELRFFEHVGGEGAYRRVQRAATPLWSRVAGGCQLNRDTGELFAGDDRFETLESERVGPDVPPVAPFVRGKMRRVSVTHD